MNHTSHAPFGTSGGGPGYLKWENANGHFMSLNLDTGVVTIFDGSWPGKGRQATYRVLPSRSWQVLKIHDPSACGARDGYTLIQMKEFAGVADCHLLIHLPNKVLRVLRLTDDGAPGSVEQFDGYWYTTERECELMVLE